MLKARAVAELLGLSVRMVYDLHARGELPGYRFGGAIRFDSADVEAYRASCRTVVAPAIGVSAPTSSTAAFKAAAKATTTDIASYFRSLGVEPKLKRPGQRAK